MSKAMTDDAPSTLAEYAFEQLRKDLKANRYGPAGRLHLAKLKPLCDDAWRWKSALSRTWKSRRTPGSSTRHSSARRAVPHAIE